MGGIYAVASAESREASHSRAGECRVVGVVDVAEYAELVVVDETVHHEVAGIAAVGAVTGRYVAEPSLLHSFLHGEVDYGLLLAVVHSREACEVALAVDYLQFVYNVDRYVLGCHLGVVGEEFFAVDEYLRHFLALRRDFSFAVNLDSRQTLQ